MLISILVILDLMLSSVIVTIAMQMQGALEQMETRLSEADRKLGYDAALAVAEADANAAYAKADANV